MLRSVLGDTSSRTETLETRLEIATAELSCRGREMKDLMTSHTRVRDELAQVKTSLGAELAAERAAREKAELERDRLVDESRRERHHLQVRT